VEFCYWVEFDGDPETGKLEARFHIHGEHNRHCESAVTAAANGAIRPPVTAAVAEAPVVH
jgi:hypothetical protein